MAHLCSVHGWTLDDLEIVDVGDDLALVCPECRADVVDDQDDSERVSVGDF